MWRGADRGSWRGRGVTYRLGLRSSVVGRREGPTYSRLGSLVWPLTSKAIISGSDPAREEPSRGTLALDKIAAWPGLRLHTRICERQAALTLAMVQWTQPHPAEPQFPHL